MLAVDTWSGPYDVLVALCRQFTAAGWDEDAFVTDSDARRRTARIELAAPDAGDATKFDERCAELRARIEAAGFRVSDVRCSRDRRQRSWWLELPDADDVTAMRRRRESAAAGRPTGTTRSRYGTSAPVRG